MNGTRPHRSRAGIAGGARRPGRENTSIKGGSMRENSIAGLGLCADGDWVAVQVRLNRERFVAQQLQMHGYDPFLPVTTAARGKTARARESSLVPGYVFCRYKVRPDFR